MRGTCSERGIALLVTLMAMTLMSALGMALALVTMTETAIAANYREGTEALYAAEAAVGYVMQEVRREPDWSRVLDGKAPSALADGPPDGTRPFGDTTIDLARETADVNVSGEGVPDAASPAWEPYASGWLDDVLAPATGRSRLYVIVWVADGSPAEDEPPPVPRVLAIRGQAYGPRGSRRAVEVTVARSSESIATERGGLHMRSWREVRR